MGTPDWTGWLNSSVFGPSVDGGSSLAIIAAASNIVIGQNPPFTIQDFFTQYPKFAGPVLLSGVNAPTASFTAGSSTAVVNNAAGMAIGQPIAGAAIPDSTFITGISGFNVQMSKPATQTVANIPIIVWNASPVPVAVLLMFINLASAHLVQARWQDSWLVAMGWFVAHFATLYAKSDGNPKSTTGQIAAQGLAGGIQISKQVGNVQVTYLPVSGLENWGSWNLTSYGQLLATMAKVIGAGPMLLY